MKRGQIYTTDVIIAISIFLFLFISIINSWEKIRVGFSITEQRNDLELITRNAIESLVNTPGNPHSWHYQNASKIQSIGLMSNRNGMISLSKALNFANQSNYEEYKKILGMNGYENSLLITIYDKNLNEIDNIGYNLSANCTHKVKTTRLALTTDENYAKINFIGCKK